MRSFTLLLLFLSSFAFPSAAQGISMSPTRLFFSGNPGKEIQQTVTMTNNSDKDFIFNIHVQDWKRDLSGNKIYFEPATLKHSNSSWVSTRETSIQLRSGETREIIVTLKVPATASPTEVTNSMLFFSQIESQKDETQKDKNIGIRALFEFGLHVYYTPEGNTNQDLEILSMEQTAKQANKNELLAIRIQNTGNVVSDASIELELTNKSSGKEINLDPISISMMPGTEQIVYFPLPDNMKGTYLGVALVKIGGSNDMRVGEKTFEFN